MLTRAALVLLYAMLDAQLSVLAQAYLHSNKFPFQNAEALFLTELVVGVDTDGDITAAEGHQQFKQRVMSVPRILRPFSLTRQKRSASQRSSCIL